MHFISIIIIFIIFLLKRMSTLKFFSIFMQESFFNAGKLSNTIKYQMARQIFTFITNDCKIIFYTKEYKNFHLNTFKIYCN